MAANLPPRRTFLATSLTSISTDEIAKNTTDEVCPICYDDYINAVKTPCGHVYCRECLLLFLDTSRSCPGCRTELFQGVSFNGHTFHLDFLSRFLDENGVADALDEFDTLMTAFTDFSVPADGQVFIDFHVLLPKLLAAAIWFKPAVSPTDDDSFDDGVCDREWRWAVAEIRDGLWQRKGGVISAVGFRDRLSREVNNEIIQYGPTDKLPNYATGRVEYARSFASDLNKVYDYITWCAVQSHSQRYPEPVTTNWSSSPVWGGPVNADDVVW